MATSTGASPIPSTSSLGRDQSGVETSQATSSKPNPRYGSKGKKRAPSRLTLEDVDDLEEAEKYIVEGSQ
jgi:hypothetical protein